MKVKWNDIILHAAVDNDGDELFRLGGGQLVRVPTFERGEIEARGDNPWVLLKVMPGDLSGAWHIVSFG